MSLNENMSRPGTNGHNLLPSGCWVFIFGMLCCQPKNILSKTIKHACNKGGCMTSLILKIYCLISVTDSKMSLLNI